MPETNPFDSALYVAPWYFDGQKPIQVGDFELGRYWQATIETPTIR